MTTTDRNCLSHWFPLILDAGLPVPRTEIVTTDLNLFGVLEGKPPAGWGDFLARLTAAVERIGLPAFLRTGQGSGKHNFDRCCNLRKIEYLGQHVYNLVDWSYTVDMLGLATDVWAVREFLPVKAMALLPCYGNMPAVREWRLFVRDGKALCHYPYWPQDALQEGIGGPVGAASLFKILARSTPELDAECIRLAERAGQAVGGGYWSVDVLEARGKLYVTDMALGEHSFHWPGCPNADTGTDRQGRRTRREKDCPLCTVRVHPHG